MFLLVTLIELLAGELYITMVRLRAGCTLPVEEWVLVYSEPDNQDSVVDALTPDAIIHNNDGTPKRKMFR